MDRACLEKTAAFRRAVVSLCACAVAFSAYAENYDSMYTDGTGYVTMTGNDSKDKSGFADKGKWSDGKPPHSGTNYYVGASRIFYTPNSADYNGHVFQGDKLVVAGQITHTAGSKATISWGNVEFLPGSKYYFNSIGQLLAGDFYVNGSEDLPFIFSVGRGKENSVRDIMQYMNVYSGPDDYMRIGQSGAFVRFSYYGDWSGFYGTFNVHTNVDVRLGSGFSSPGRFVVPKDGMLGLLNDNNIATLGTLEVESGGRLNFAKGSSTGTLFHITNRLALAAGAIVDSSNIFDRTESPIHTSMVFRLSPKTVAAGLPDWNSLVYPYRKKGEIGDLPHVVPFEMDDPEVEGGKYFGLRMKQIVYMTNSCSHSASALDLEYNRPQDFWSNARWPEAGIDYVIGAQLIIFNNVNPYVFPGDSLTVRAANVASYDDITDITFNDAVFLGETRLRPLTGDASYVLRGNLKLMANEDYPNPAVVTIYNRVDYTIASDVSGDNDLHVKLMRLGGKMARPSGVIRLSGMNTNWTGRLLVAATNDVNELSSGALCAVSALTNLTLRISDSRNLGGRMKSFVYDSLTVSNQCRLAIDGTTTFGELTRGWYFPRTAYLYVTNDAMATCLNTITLGDELVKEGPGTFCLASTPSIEGDSASITVKEGIFAAGTSDAFKGLSVNFAEGAALGIDIASSNESFAAKGIDITDVELSSDNGKISVSLLGAEFDPGVKNGPYALVTCPTDDLEELKSKLSICKPWKGSGMSVSFIEKENEDGTVTLSAKLSPCTLRIIIR